MVNEMAKEHKILKKLKKQKCGALDEAIEQYTPYVSVIVYNIIGRVMTREDMEEVVSSVFITLWNHSSELDSDKGSVRSYLGAVARNHAKNKLRELRPHLPIEDFEKSVGEIIYDPQSEFERQEHKKILWDMVHELGEPDSEIFLRYYYYEEKIKHIAEYTGLCVSTVKTKLARGRQKLKEKIIERGEYI